jgi:RNA polymerase-binding protein DksA
MNKDFIKKTKQALGKRKEEITKELNQITTKDSHKKGGRVTSFNDVGDKQDENAQEVENYTTNLATDKILEDELRDIEGALKRMEDGTYGVCKYCGKEIEEKRMEVRPVASSCVECKTKLQRGLI